MEELSARAVRPLVGMSAEVIPLRLNHVRRQVRAAIAVVVSQRRRQSRNRQPVQNRRRHDAPPALLRVFDRGPEIIVEKQVLKPGVLIESALDIAEENRSDDTAAAPHQRDIAEFQIPAVRPRRRAHQGVALRV